MISQLKKQDGRVSGTIFEKRIWTVDEVAYFLGLTKKTIYNKVSRREIPFRKPKGGRRLYFMPDEILNWVEEGLR